MTILVVLIKLVSSVSKIIPVQVGLACGVNLAVYAHEGEDLFSNLICVIVHVLERGGKLRQ